MFPRPGKKPTSLPQILNKDMQLSGWQLRNEVHLEQLRMLRIANLATWEGVTGFIIDNVREYETEMETRAEEKRKDRTAVKINPKRKSGWKSSEQDSRKKIRVLDDAGEISAPSKKRRRADPAEVVVEAKRRREEEERQRAIPYSLRPRKPINSFRGQTR